MEPHLHHVASVTHWLRVVLAIAMAAGPSAAVWAQGYGAQQAVRQRVEGVGTSPEEAAASVPRLGPEEISSQSEPSNDGIDTTFIASGAALIVAVRPAQVMSAPIAEMLPTEVASAAGLSFLGIDPATVDEVVAFVDPSNMAAPAYGVIVQFNQPFRGAAIPPHARPYAQLGELAGRKYLQSGHPMWPSFYGTNSQTLVAAPDATLRPLAEAESQPSTGPLVDRVRDVPAGNDLYVAVDVAALRPLLAMFMGMASAQMPDDAKQFLEAPNLISVAEFTLNVSSPGPTSLVLHTNDEAAAQQLETMMFEIAAGNDATPESQRLGAEDPIAQAMTQYQQRMSQSFGRRRDGTSVICFHIDGHNPAQQQLVTSLVVVGASMLVPILEAARQSAQPPAVEEPAAEPSIGPEGEPGF